MFLFVIWSVTALHKTLFLELEDTSFYSPSCGSKLIEMSCLSVRSVGCLMCVSQVAVLCCCRNTKVSEWAMFQCGGPKRAVPMVLHIQVISEPFSMPVSVTVIAVSCFETFT